MASLVASMAALLMRLVSLRLKRRRVTQWYTRVMLSTPPTFSKMTLRSSSYFMVPSFRLFMLEMCLILCTHLFWLLFNLFYLHKSITIA